MALRAEEAHGRAAAEEQIARNLATVVALLLPLAAGYWLVLPAFEALLVPAPYRGAFLAYSTILIPALFAFALIQYALNPVFQLRRRTRPVVLAALAALGANAALLPVLPPVLGPTGVALAQLAGLAFAALVFTALAMREGGLRLPWRDIARAAATTAAMIVAVLPLRAVEPPVLALAASVIARGAVYAALAYALDIAGLRALVRSHLSRRPAVLAPAE